MKLNDQLCPTESVPFRITGGSVGPRGEADCGSVSVDSPRSGGNTEIRFSIPSVHGTVSGAVVAGCESGPFNECPPAGAGVAGGCARVGANTASNDSRVASVLIPLEQYTDDSR